MYKSKLKEYIREYNKKYYQKNKLNRYKKYYCEICRDEYCNLPRHYKSKKHYRNKNKL